MSLKPPTPTLREVKEEQPNRLVHTAFSGPIPPPEILAKYETIQTGLVNRIVTMAESETIHRQTIEKKGLSFDIKKSNRTQTEIISRTNIFFYNLFMCHYLWYLSNFTRTYNNRHNYWC